MPFFYRWCYADGCPAYHLVRFESKEGKGGWETMVTIRNDGVGIVRCALELRMEGGSGEEAFWVEGGQERTFVYRTQKKVMEVVIDPKATAYQADEKKNCLAIEEGEPTQKEKAAILEFYRVRAEIEKGARFEDGSTPLRSVLSFLSAYKARDAEVAKRLLVWPGDVTRGTIGRDDLYTVFCKMDVLRAPLPPDDVKDGTLWLIYMKEPGLYDLDGLLFILWKGRWMQCGNMGGPASTLGWRRHASEIGTRIVEVLRGR